ncbi:MAG: TetR/AcrR family transcriptional regulator [Firmicutes bacterium]|nr:TetR/AcrR family transcriptional regulator [Bacillota bacterium]
MPENQRVRLTKKLLKDSLVRLLQQSSIHRISVRDICEGAEVNRTTFYKYYGSQYDLLGDMENDVLLEIEGYLSSDGPQPTDAAQLTQIIRYLETNMDMCKVLLSNNVDPDFPEKIVNLPRIRELVALSMNESGQNERNYITRFLVDGCFGLIKMWVSIENREPAEHIAGLLDQMVLRMGTGTAAEK